MLFSILALCWGSSFVAIEVGLEYVPPLLFAGGRYALAGVIVLAYAAVVTDQLWPSARGEWLAVAVAGIFVIALYHGLLYLGELYVSGAVAATVVSTAPILTVAFAGLLLPEERLAPAGVVGFVLGLVGVVAVVQPSGATLGGEMVVGVALVFASAIAFALGSVFLKPISSSLPLETLQAWAMLLGAGVLLGWAALRGESIAAVAVTPESLLSFAYLTLVSGVFAFLLYFELLERTGATQVNLVSYAEPAVAMAVSWAIMGYVVDSLTVLGLLTIIAGFVVVKRRALQALLRSTRVSRSTFVADIRDADHRSGARTDGGVTLESDAESTVDSEAPSTLEADTGPATSTSEPADD
ncbi:EamA family transporter [Natronolimnobius sp. AArcel1]|nr:EamA family transporter [Natronolimnobius sp. AArcel1]